MKQLTFTMMFGLCAIVQASEQSSATPVTYVLFQDAPGTQAAFLSHEAICSQAQRITKRFNTDYSSQSLHNYLYALPISEQQAIKERVIHELTLYALRVKTVVSDPTQMEAILKSLAPAILRSCIAFHKSSSLLGKHE